MTFEELRQSFKPEIVRILFIGESRPIGETFFYCENSKLFKYTKQAFDAVFHMDLHCNTFKELGCYLYDICDNPVNHLTPPERRNEIRRGLPNLVCTLNELNPEYVIIVKRSNFRNILMEPITNAGFSEEDKAFFLPFPSNGNQINYANQLINILKYQNVVSAPSPTPKSNAFLLLLENKLCTKFYCTTCGCMPFRNEVKKLGSSFYEAMVALDESELLSYDNHLDCINIAFRCIADFNKRGHLMKHWPNIFKKLTENKNYEFNGVFLTPVFEEFKM